MVVVRTVDHISHAGLSTFGETQELTDPYLQRVHWLAHKLGESQPSGLFGEHVLKQNLLQSTHFEIGVIREVMRIEG